jgi:voltage-gated potassium channel
LRRNWLTALALVLPAFRVLRVLRAFRFFRAARAARSVGLLRLLTSLNRGMRATRRALRRRGVGYVAALTLLVTFAGAAGMYLFENPATLREAGHDRGSGGLASYGEALWWTAMIMTTMGTEYWPRTVEGRIVCGLLALYAFAFFGYLTATIASYFIGHDRQAEGLSPAAAESAVLRNEVASLHTLLASVLGELAKQRPAALAFEKSSDERRKRVSGRSAG